MRTIKYIFVICTLWALPSYAQNDIELTDSTSTEWGGGGGGGLTPSNPTDPVTTLSLSQTSVTLAGGQTLRLVATVNSSAANKAVSWQSGNPDIASVSENGVVRGLKKGTTTITVTAAGNTSLKKTCQVTVTSDYEGLRLPDVSYEFCYDAADYDASTQSIPNHEDANLKGYSMKLSENIPTFVDNMLLRIEDRCEGYIDKWEKGSSESGSYFYRSGTDCMTIVAKVAPRKRENASDFICNRDGGYNYMWRIGSDLNASFLHTGRAWDDSRALFLPSEEPQVLAVRVDGPNDKINLQNLTTGDSHIVEGVDWGGSGNVFKFFYNDESEFFLGDFYWVYYSFELLTDAQLKVFDESVLLGDVNNDNAVDIADAVCIVNHIVGKATPSFIEKAADANGDGVVDIADAVRIVNLIVGKINALARQRYVSLPEPE